MEANNLMDLELAVAAEVDRRKSLGGYNADAAAILLLAEAVLAMLVHINSNADPSN